MKTKTREFLEKLKALLIEYDATLDFTYEGDSYGIYGENCSACLNGESISIKDFGAYGTYIEPSGIEHALKSQS